jgi:beta-carotene 3-hydroxylase
VAAAGRAQGAPPVILDLAVIAAAVVAMEGLAYLTHRFVMHGRFGWRLHRDHHDEHDGLFQWNDLYAVLFTGVVILLFVGDWPWPARPIAIGASLYGLLYFIVHDGLVHQRWPFRRVPRKGYLRRLYQAHKLHHATEGREGAVSFGFLYAPPIRELKTRLGREAAGSDGL